MLLIKIHKPRNPIVNKLNKNKCTLTKVNLPSIYCKSLLSRMKKMMKINGKAGKTRSNQ